MPEVFIRAKTVAARTGHSIRSVKRKAADPEESFPAAIRLSDRVLVWVQSEVDGWISDQIALHRGLNDAAPTDAPDEDDEPEAAETRPYARTGTGPRSRRRREATP